MKVASMNMKENKLKRSEEIAESLSYQIDALKGSLNLLRWDIDDELPDGKVQLQWVNLLSVIDITLEKMSADAEKLTDDLISIQMMKRPENKSATPIQL